MLLYCFYYNLSDIYEEFLGSSCLLDCSYYFLPFSSHKYRFLNSLLLLRYSIVLNRNGTNDVDVVGADQVAFRIVPRADIKLLSMLIMSNAIQV